MEVSQPPLIPSSGARRLSVFLKIAGILLLTALLHVPLKMTRGVLRERQGYQEQATREIAETWGQSQLIVGPVLVVPWVQTTKRTSEWKDATGKVFAKEETQTNGGHLYFLPEELRITARLDPEVRYRGIFEAVVYGAKIEITGSFRVAVPGDELPDTVYHWEKARLCFGTSDLRRLRASPVVRWGGEAVAVEANGSSEAPGLGLAAAVGGAGPGKRVDYSIAMGLQGSGRLEFAPVGRQTEVTVSSAWRDPSFTGAHLPAMREITESGFTAQWAMGPFGREYPFAWSSREGNAREHIGRFGTSALGVAFDKPVDGYRLAERAQKYGVLFFVLVFAVFFLFEVTAALRIHPLQYAMVGAALCLFFLGFLALSEFLATGLAYGLAAGACTLLVSLYAWSFLRTGRRTLVIGGGLGATYGYLYFVLQSQDYALLAGTGALFAALALIMWATRRINWYSLEMSADAPVAPRTEARS